MYLSPHFFGLKVRHKSDLLVVTRKWYLKRILLEESYYFVSVNLSTVWTVDVHGSYNRLSGVLEQYNRAWTQSSVPTHINLSHVTPTFLVLGPCPSNLNVKYRSENYKPSVLTYCIVYFFSFHWIFTQERIDQSYMLHRVCLIWTF